MQNVEEDRQIYQMADLLCHGGHLCVVLFARLSLRDVVCCGLFILILSKTEIREFFQNPGKNNFEQFGTP
jgi:hypothetical protein